MANTFAVSASAALLFTLITGAAGAANLPDCLDRHGHPLPVNNGRPLEWKISTRNRFRARAHVQGVVVSDDRFADRNGHYHFAIEVTDSGEHGLLEVVFNEEFGSLPRLREGMHIEACGDFINSSGRGGRGGELPPSPAGAIIHWLHHDPGGGHPSGYIAVNGNVFGTDEERRQTRRSRRFDPDTYYSPGSD